jgi:NAD(P)-dependent dehydrogenase (short-subunit alcohol dehydrogenase family)
MASSWDLTGKVVLITGAARGIGAESARRLNGKGCKVSLVGLEPERLAAVAESIGPNAAWFEADVRDSEALKRAVSGTVERFGGIDVVIANAGIATVGSVEALDPEDWERVIDVNLLGVYRTVHAALPHVIERKGYILPIASLAAVLHAPMMANYTAAKAGVEAFADSLRGEMSIHGVGVGCAYFSFIDTDMVSQAFEHPVLAEQPPDRRGPLGSVAPLSEVGDAIARGVERRSRWVTVPRWVAGAIVLRGAIQPLVEWGARKRPDFKETLSKLNADPRTKLAAKREGSAPEQAAILPDDSPNGGAPEAAEQSSG